MRVIGDLADLVPPADAAAAGEPDADPSDGELLDAAVDGLAGLGVVLAEARIEHEALVRAVEQWVRDEVTDADWEAFRGVRGVASRAAVRADGRESLPPVAAGTMT